jgi:hypothetical protein
MKLFRVAMKSVNQWDTKIRNLYVIQPTREDVIDYINHNKADKFEIYKIYYLGYELSRVMFRGGKESAIR